MQQLSFGGPPFFTVRSLFAFCLPHSVHRDQLGADGEVVRVLPGRKVKGRIHPKTKRLARQTG